MQILVFLLLAVKAIQPDPGVPTPFSPDNITAPSLKPIPAHAHNDYYHDRPLLDAMRYRFRSVEADVYSRGDSLYVAHDRNEITTGRTLRNLYLDPLDSLVGMNGGTLYPHATPLILLVDIKDRGISTYRLLHQILEEYVHLLSYYTGDGIKPGGLMVIVSGNRPIRFMEEQNERYAFVDGRLPDLDKNYTPELMPLISDHWGRNFNWSGNGEIPEAESGKLHEIVSRAHRNGQMIRFWATPDKPGMERRAVWEEIRDAGIDLINTDDLEGLHAFLTGSTNGIKRRCKGHGPILETAETAFLRPGTHGGCDRYGIPRAGGIGLFSPEAACAVH